MIVSKPLPFYVVEADQLPDRVVWQALERRTQRSFFLSWTWMRTWMTQHANGAKVLQIFDAEDVLVGCCVVQMATRYRFGLPIKQAYLHQTGDPERDVICVEYNDILCDDAHKAQVYDTVLAHLSCDELIISGATQEAAHLWSQRSDWHVHTLAQARSARVDLSFDGREAYLARLGKSTRASLRRSLRLYEGQGPLQVQVAQSAQDAWAMLEEAQPHHRNRWGKAALDYAGYRTFHQSLIKVGFDQSCVDVLRVTCGDTPIGWLYNFIDRGQVYYYFGAFAFDDNPKLKPGLVTHLLAMEHYACKGLAVYDFMGGDLRYKFNLGQAGPDIVTIALQKQTLPLCTERLARWIKKAVCS